MDQQKDSGTRRSTAGTNVTFITTALTSKINASGAFSWMSIFYFDRNPTIYHHTENFLYLILVSKNKPQNINQTNDSVYTTRLRFIEVYKQHSDDVFLYATLGILIYVDDIN